MTTELDETDRAILKILHEDGRAPYNKIGERLDITGNTVRRRVDRMRDEGVIRKFSVLTDPAVLDHFTVTFGMTVEAGKTKETADELAEEECVYKLWILSGTHNVIIDARFESTEQFQNFVHERLLELDGIESYESSIVTQSVVDDGSVVFENEHGSEANTE